MSQNTIPCLNLQQYTQGTPADKEAFIRSLGSAFANLGFVTISGHSLQQQVIDDLYAAIKKVFALPPSVKHQYEIPGLAGQRGYTGPNKETAKGASVPDLKEFWQIGQFVEDDDPVKTTYPPNINIPEVPEFYTLTRQVYKTLEHDGFILLEAIALHLGLPADYFMQYVHNGNSILRAIHYFPLATQANQPGDTHTNTGATAHSAAPGAVRAGAHEDINLITLLIGASADGLEVLTRSNEWLPIRAGHSELVVNVGDMLQRLTNNKLKSTTHRVVNPPQAKLQESRYSVPFFLHPKVSMSLSCLPSCITAQSPKAYTDITAGEYLNQRLREIGLKA